MKLLVLKLSSLMVLLAGLLTLGLLFNIPEAEEFYLGVTERLAAMTDQSRDILWGAVAGALIVFGFYGVMPRIPRGAKKNAIRFNGEHGEVVLQLNPIQQSLNKIIAGMPEVRKATIKVRPDNSQATARIDADVVLEKQPDFKARDTANLVAQLIEETAKKLLGLEELTHIRLNVTGIHVDTKHTVKDMHDHLADQARTRVESERGFTRDRDRASALAAGAVGAATAVSLSGVETAEHQADAGAPERGAAPEDGDADAMGIPVDAPIQPVGYAATVPETEQRAADDAAEAETASFEEDAPAVAPLEQDEDDTRLGVLDEAGATGEAAPADFDAAPVASSDMDRDDEEEEGSPFSGAPAEPGDADPPADDGDPHKDERW